MINSALMNNSCFAKTNKPLSNNYAYSTDCLKPQPALNDKVTFKGMPTISEKERHGIIETFTENIIQLANRDQLSLTKVQAAINKLTNDVPI